MNDSLRIIEEIALIEAAGLPLSSFDEDAFDAAKDAFLEARQLPSYADAEDNERSLDEALRTFLGVYMEVRR